MTSSRLAIHGVVSSTLAIGLAASAALSSEGLGMLFLALAAVIPFAWAVRAEPRRGSIVRPPAGVLIVPPPRISTLVLAPLPRRPRLGSIDGLGIVTPYETPARPSLEAH